MPTVTKPAGQQNVPSIERPLAHSFAPHALMGEYLMMIPLMPSHQYNLHADIFSQPQVMRYCGTGSSFTGDEYTSLHLERAKQNLTPQYNQNTSRVTRFTWTIITRDGIAGVPACCKRWFLFDQNKPAKYAPQKMNQSFDIDSSSSHKCLNLHIMNASIFSFSKTMVIFQFIHYPFNFP